MRLWTVQGIKIYDQLQKVGVAYCTKPVWGNDSKFVYAYHWMAEQMKKRIGDPPIEGIEYPIWAWYQYDSAKKNKPPRSPMDFCDGLSAYMEIEIPDNEVLLSDYSSWHSVLNQGPIENWRRLFKEMDKADAAAGKMLELNEYPEDLRLRIENSWEPVFDLDRRDDVTGRKHKRNRSIQATFWVLRKENLISAEIYEKVNKNLKRIKL